MKLDGKKYWLLLKGAVSSWQEDKVPRLGAALAYYTLFSVAPLLILATAVAGIVFGEDAVRGHLSEQLRHMMGPEGSRAIEAMVASAHKPSSNILAAIVSIVVLLIGASGVFGELQDALNTIWKVKPKKGRGVLRVLRDRVLSFAMVLVIGFLMLVSLVISTILSALSGWAGESHPELIYVWQGVHHLAAFGVSTLLFAMLFKVLPDAKIAWRDVGVGAVITSLLFALGKYLIALYLGQSSVASVYGAAGSVVIILVWTYYSAQILLFGAEFTQAFACLRRGCEVEPSANAERVLPEERAAQGLAPTKSYLQVHSS